MPPLARNSNNKYGSRKRINKQSKVSQNSNKRKLKEISEGKIDIISNLPLECSQEIILYLTKNDVASIWNCSRDWKNVMRGNYFWKKRCRLDYPVLLDQNEKSKFFHQYVEKFDCYWQGVYSYYQMLLNNWKNNNFKKTLRNCSIDNFHYFDENILIISSERNKLKMIDASTGNKINTKLSGHKVSISEVFKIENFLVSVCFNCIIKVWDLSKNGICILTKKLPYRPAAIFASKNVIACASMLNSEVFIYDFKGIHIYSHNLNSGEFVRVICIQDNIMAMGTQEGNLNIVELNSKNLARHLCFAPNLRKIMIKNGYLFCLLYSGIVRVYNIKTAISLWWFFNQYDTPLTFLNENKFVKNELDQHFIRMLDFATGEILLEIKNQYVTKYLASNSRFIVAQVPYEKAIKVWCSKTKELITQISFSSIGIKKGHSISHAQVTDSKLVLRCRPQRGTNVKAYLVLLNFENDRNVINKN